MQYKIEISRTAKQNGEYCSTVAKFATTQNEGNHSHSFFKVFIHI